MEHIFSSISIFLIETQWVTEAQQHPDEKTSNLHIPVTNVILRNKKKQKIHSNIIR